MGRSNYLITIMHFHSSYSPILRDIRVVLVTSHIQYTGILHGNMCFNNVLRPFSLETASIYPRHQTVHEWCLIDFNKACKTIFTEESPQNKN